MQLPPEERFPGTARHVPTKYWFNRCYSSSGPACWIGGLFLTHFPLPLLPGVALGGKGDRLRGQRVREDGREGGERAYRPLQGAGSSRVNRVKVQWLGARRPDRSACQNGGVGVHQSAERERELSPVLFFGERV